MLGRLVLLAIGAWALIIGVSLLAVDVAQHLGSGL